jgi:CubicO group peptidase (beta-lactamase class C family)
MLERIQEQDYNIDSLTIIRNGTIVTDATFYPFTKDKKHIIHSCTKSIVSALVGIAIENGYIENVDQPVLSLFPEKMPANVDLAKQELTLEHLLMMGSGLDCHDSYLYNWVGLNEMRASDDWVQHMLNLPMIAEPGTHFEYCNGGSYLIAAILQQTTGMSALAFAEHHLFEPLGITDVHWPASPQDINIGWGDMYLKPHDMAKIGLLYLNEGNWEDNQLIPSTWVQASTSPQIRSGTLSDDYGYQWWVDSEGYYMALGFAGQFIFVIPEKNMVVVFTSGGDFPVPENLLNNYILPSATAEEPLPPNPDANERLKHIIQDSVNPPDPEPLTPLPDTAERISGHMYSFDLNNLDFKQFSLTFHETKAVYTLSYRDRYIEVDVGLDGVYRLTDAAGYTRAFQAYWENDDTFRMNYELVGYSEKGQYTMIFNGDRVSIRFLEASTGTFENLTAQIQN